MSGGADSVLDAYAGSLVGDDEVAPPADIPSGGADSVLDAYVQQTPDAAQVLDTVSHQDPDQAATVFDAANKSDIPVGLVNDNLAEVQRQQRMVDAKPETFGPTLNSMMGIPENAVLMQDDLDNLRRTEELLATGWAAEPKGSVKRQVSDIGGHFVDIGKTIYAGALGASASFQGTLEAGIDTVGLGDTATAQYLRRQREYGQARAQGLTPEGPVYGGLRSSVQNLLTIAGTQGRSTLPAMGAMVFGESYTEAHDQGLSTPNSLLFGMTDAVVEMLTEKLPLGELFKSLKDGQGYLKTLGKQFLTEVPTEQVATLLQDLNAWAMLPENSDATFDDYLSQRGAAAFDTLIATMVGAATTTTVTHLAAKGVNSFNERAAAKETERFRAGLRAAMENDERNVASEADQGRIDELITLAQSTKVGPRMGDTYEEFLKGAGSDQKVYVPADVIGNLEDVEVPQAFLDQIDGLGADIEIPIETFMAEVVNDDALMEALRPHIRMGEDLMSANDIEQGGDMTTRRLLERAQVAADARQEIDVITDSITEQLIATGRMSRSDALKNTSLVKSRIGNLVADHGLTPAQAHAYLNTSIVGQDAPGLAEAQVMEQTVYHGGALETPTRQSGGLIFTSADQEQAAQYGDVQEFDLDTSKLASENVARQFLTDLGIEPLNTGWRSEESSLYELLDPQFEQFIGDDNVAALKEKMKEAGYIGTKILDQDMRPTGSGRQTAENIVVFDRGSLDSTRQQINKRRYMLEKLKDCLNTG